MKKALLLSVVASTMIMAGGDIAPVEPVVVVEEIVETSGWDFSGQAALYYQTNDELSGVWGASDLFKQASSKADAGIQLRAVNKDVFAGIGAGVEVNGLATLGLENWMVSNVMQNPSADNLSGGWVSQAYLTYGFGNTMIKVGRQELPKSLSPFAFSEHWNVFANTFDAALVVNTDLSDTTLVYAWVSQANNNAGTDMAAFTNLNDHDGVHMLTVQNKSIDGLTLTGSFYYAANYADNNLGANSGKALTILWGDAKYNTGALSLAGQVGTFMDDDFGAAGDSVAYGLKAGYDFGMFDASLAYSHVNDGGIQNKTMVNTGGVKTPLYTQMILNQSHISFDNDTFVARASVEALSGKFSLAYDYTTDDSAANDNYRELDLVYTTKIASTDLFVGYIYQDLDSKADNSNTVRIWGRYNF